MKRRVLLGWASLCALTAGAQTRREQRAVYRCGNTVSDRPCAADTPASQVGFDQPSEADRRAAVARARAEKERADREERERLAAEREALRANTPAPRDAPPKRTTKQKDTPPRKARSPKRRASD